MSEADRDRAGFSSQRHLSMSLPRCPVLRCAVHLDRAGVGGWAESGVNPAEYSRMLMRVACAYIEGADVRAVSSLDSWQSNPCASLNRWEGVGVEEGRGGGKGRASRVLPGQLAVQPLRLTQQV